MLFCLRSRDGSLQYLLNNRQYTVGRKECDILITNDQSVSRKHAEFSVTVDKLILCDCGSRYRTSVNDSKLEASVETVLKNGDVVKFGMLQSTYIFEEINIIMTTSSIKSNQKMQLKNHIATLGGSLVSNWNPTCTHVSVEEIMLTVKVLCAIVKGIPIVKLKYWEDYVAMVKQNLPPPEVANYKPICSELVLSHNISLEFKEERRSVFKNKTFVFPTKSDKMKMIDLIELAGGNAISWDTNPITKTDIDTFPGKYIILQTGEVSDSKMKADLRNLIDYISGLGKRTIPIQEIALAILNCSCEKDCNPDFDRSGTVLAAKTQSQAQKGAGHVLAKETQLNSQSQAFNLMDTETAKSELVIPQSMTEHAFPIENTPNMTLQDSQKISPSIEAISQSEALQIEVEVGIKREGDLMEGPIGIKKMKIESGPLFTKGKQKKDVNNLVEFNSQASRAKESEQQGGKSLFAFKSDKNSNETTTDSEDLVSNPFTKKRKALPSDSENPPKKPSPAIDTTLSSMPPPSTLKVSTSSDENPFANIRKTRSTATTFNFRSAQISPVSKPKKSTAALLSSTVINENPNSLQMDFSEIKPVEFCLDRSNGWISKLVCGDNTVDKHSSKTNGLEEHHDEELSKYIESFKNTVVIATEDKLVVRKSKVSDNDESSMANVKEGLRNFKKFKKVEPLRIQTTMIPESNYVNIICNERCAIQVVGEESESEDDNNMGPPRNLRKRYEF